jgi:hypothetical protein
LGVQEAFKILKLHSLWHYNESIKLFGTTNNYNTQATEKLHIDYTKDAYRATNTKDEYLQMTHWMEHQEQLFHHAQYISWQLLVDHHIPSQQTPVIEPERLAVMPKHPSVHSVTLNTIITEYGATYTRKAIAYFITKGNHPDWTQCQIEDVVVNTFLPFHAVVSVFHKMKFVSQQSRDSVVVDTIHAQPAQQSRHRKCSVSGQFDTALINVQEGENIGVQGILPICSQFITFTQAMLGYHVAQVCLIFSLPCTAITLFTPHHEPPPPNALPTLNGLHHSLMHQNQTTSCIS